MDDPYAGIDLEFNDDGSISVAGLAPEDGTVDGDVANPTGTASAEPAAPVDPNIARMDAIEARFDKLTELLVNKLGTPAETKAADTSLDDELASVETPRDMVRVIKTSVQKLINDAVAPYQERLNTMTAQQGVVNMLLTHGEEFRSRIPAIQEVMKAVPGISVEAAFDMVKKLSPAPIATKPTMTAKPAQTLVQRSNTLKLDSSDGVNNKVVSDKREIKTVRDAMLAAMDEIRVSNTR